MLESILLRLIEEGDSLDLLVIEGLNYFLKVAVVQEGLVDFSLLLVFECFHELSVHRRVFTRRRSTFLVFLDSRRYLSATYQRERCARRTGRS